MKITVVVNNFNYAEFLGDAVDSALAQHDADTEVVVVDDGSTDESREILRRYGDSIRTVLKDNGGQASAFNAGFRASRGDVVIFLDADDTLLPDTAARVAEVFSRSPDIAKVHYPLEIVDDSQRPVGASIPARNLQLPQGDLRNRVLRSPADITYPPTSGNAFSASCLHQILPIPEHEYRSCADVYLINLASLIGPLGRLEEIGGRYRVHNRNTHFRGNFDLDRVRSTIRATEATHAHLAALASRLGLRPPGRVASASVTDLAQRLISCRLDPAGHPIASDRAAALAVRGSAAALRRRDLAVRSRLLYVGWFFAAAVAPRRSVRWLGDELFRTWRRVGWGSTRGISPS